MVKQVPGCGLEQRESGKTALYLLIIIIILISYIIIYYYEIIKSVYSLWVQIVCLEIRRHLWPVIFNVSRLVSNISRKIDCSSFVMCLLLVLALPWVFFAAAINSTNQTNKADSVPLSSLFYTMSMVSAPNIKVKWD